MRKWLWFGVAWALVLGGCGSSNDPTPSDGDEETAVCAATMCAIGGVCYADGADNPTSPCQSCQTATSRTAWANKAYGASCMDGNSCTKNDVCDGQGACKGEADPNCTADGDYEGGDVDPDDVVIGASCPEQGINTCKSETLITCSYQKLWVYTGNCADTGYTCLNGACADPSNTPGYQGCSAGDIRCVKNDQQTCSLAKEWVSSGMCANGDKCCFGSCTPTSQCPY